MLISGKLEAVLRFLSKQGQLQPHFYSKAGKLKYITLKWSIPCKSNATAPVQTTSPMSFFQVVRGCICQQRYSTAPSTRSWKVFLKQFKNDCLNKHKVLTIIILSFWIAMLAHNNIIVILIIRCCQYMSSCRAITQFRWQHTVPPRQEPKKVQTVSVLLQMKKKVYYC